MIVEHKYHGTPKFRAVIARLLQIARDKEAPILYGEVFKLMGLKAGNHAAAEAGHLLGEISERCHLQGEPMLSALVVNKDTGIPGEGFYTLAKSLGKLEQNAPLPRLKEFWQSELRSIYSTSW